MKRLITLAFAALAAVTVVASALGDTPFPGTRAGVVIVSAQTVNLNRTVVNHFRPNGKVVFRASALNTKTHKFVTSKEVKSFFVRIPNAANVNLTYRPKGLAASGSYVWIGKWVVPANYPLGVVKFTVFVRTKSKLTGSFKQVPIVNSQLTITLNPPPPPGPGPTSPPPPSKASGDVPLYVDTVNGSRPKNAAPRLIGCTQTNVFKRGEQIVPRAFGYDMSDRSVLTPENVTDAHFSVPGQPKIALNWGGHGNPKVWYWTGFWNIPLDYPLGDIPIRVSFTTVGGKTGVANYMVTIIP